MNTQAHTNHSDGTAQAIDTRPHDDPNARGGESGRGKKRLARLLVAAVAAIGIGAPAMAMTEAAPVSASSNGYSTFYNCWVTPAQWGYAPMTLLSGYTARLMSINPYTWAATEIGRGKVGSNACTWTTTYVGNLYRVDVWVPYMGRWFQGVSFKGGWWDGRQNIIFTW